ncbi:MarR family winged helix-turn-helix transcriptional regulator [Staphylospora marina]|uniref:MarR family winged helix-turn-helix transcriptional regulator n=1 Tax=Staphylospora marina TaxID=2490858 RepID=UPI0013DDFDE8|nr:MarR family transcriptional regulator [Staphylospora marina]
MQDRMDLISELEQCFRLALRTMRKEMSVIFGDRINGAEFGVLKLLARKSPRIVTEIAQEFEVSVSHITHVVDQLVKKRLVQRIRSQSDKRVVELHLTEQGRALVEELSEKKRKYLLERFEPLSDGDLRKLCDLLHKLR